MKVHKHLILSVLAMASLGTAAAAPVTVADYSFESTTGSSPNGLLDNPDGTLGGWQYFRTGVLAPTLTDVNFVSNPGLATDGNNVAQIGFLAGVLASGTLFQDLNTSYLANSIYTLTFDTDQVSLLTALNGASANLYAGNSIVASLGGNTLLSLLDGTTDLETVSFQFTTGAVAPVGDIGVGFSIGGVAEVAGSGLIIDNVRLDVVPVPEPGSALMIAMAGGWLHLVRRRRLI